MVDNIASRQHAERIYYVLYITYTYKSLPIVPIFNLNAIERRTRTSIGDENTAPTIILT